MNLTRKMFLVAAVAAFSMPVVADNHEEDGDYMLNIMKLEIKHGHGMKFRQAMKEYMECYEENDGEGSWTTWANVDGAPNEMHIVSRMDMWAEMDDEDPARAECWPKHFEALTSNVASANGRYWRRMPDWSGDAENFSVVTLHNFRVEDGDAFREVVTEVTGHMKAAEAEHMGTWYRSIGSQRWGADYFVVSHYENFAARDADRQGANDYLVAAVGEEAAEAIWDKFQESMAEMEPYWTQTLTRVDSMSYSAED